MSRLIFAFLALGTVALPAFAPSATARPRRSPEGGVGAKVTAGATDVAVAQDRAPSRREFTIVAENFRFTPDKIEVSEDDLVKLALRGVDQPYSFVIDAYRIVKRVGRDQTIWFEFRADQPGTFTFYCNMSADPRCKEMRGTLLVRAR